MAILTDWLDVVPELLDFALTRNSEKLPPPQVTSHCKNTLYVLEWAGRANRFIDKVPRDDLSRVDLAIEVDASTMEDLDLYRDQCSHGLWETFIRKMKAFSERDDMLHINFLVALPNFTDPNSLRDEIEKVTEQYPERGYSRSIHLEMEDEEWRWLWAERDWL